MIDDLGQARRVLRGVVVELVAGDDLARAEQLEAGVVVADDADLEVAGAGEIGLGEGDRVVAERLVERGRVLVGAVGERHPDARAQPRRLDHQPRVAGSGRERLELAQDGRPLARPARRADLDPVDDRQPDPPREPLEDRLVHADRRRGDARSGVGEAGRLEQRLDRAVLAERPVERDEHDRVAVRARGAGRAPRRSSPGRSRPARAGRRRPPVRGPRGGGPPAAATSGR